MSLDEMKAMLISNLAKAAACKSLDLTLGVQFFQEYFCFATKCRLNSKKPLEILGGEKKFFYDLGTLIPNLDDQVYDKCQQWGSERARTMRILRSGIQFLEDDILINNDDLKPKWAEFLKGDGMDELNEKLAMFSGSRAEYDDRADPTDLRFVPEEHSWWSDLERGDSKVKFGETQ